MEGKSELKPFATDMDIFQAIPEITSYEYSTAVELLPVVSNMLRFEADKVGKNLDAMVGEIAGFADIVKWVVLDIVTRYITNHPHTVGNVGRSSDGRIAEKNGGSLPVTQTTHSAGGYSVTNTYQTPVPGLYIKKSELARLGLRRQQVGVINFGGSV